MQQTPSGLVAANEAVGGGAAAATLTTEGALLLGGTAVFAVGQSQSQQQGAGSTATSGGGTGGSSGFGDISGGATTAENALAQAEKYCGPGYNEIAPGVYRSADGLRQFRMTTSDLTDPTQGTHVHFEAIGPDGRTILENSHVGIIP